MKQTKEQIALSKKLSLEKNKEREDILNKKLGIYTGISKKVNDKKTRKRQEEITRLWHLYGNFMFPNHKKFKEEDEIELEDEIENEDEENDEE